MNSAELEHACISFWGKRLLSMPGPLTSCSWATVPFYNVKEDSNEVFLDRFLINYMVEADPDDILKFRAYDGDETEIFQMNSHAWLQSVDYLLYRQLTLALRKDNSSTIALRVPTMIQEKYHDYKHDNTDSRNKLSVPIPSYFPKPSIFENLCQADGYTSISFHFFRNIQLQKIRPKWMCTWSALMPIFSASVPHWIGAPSRVSLLNT